MLTGEGPEVLEYNVRFGDPETQVVLPAARGDPAELPGRWPRAARRPAPAFVRRRGVCVVVAARGLPERPRAGRGNRGAGRRGQPPAVDGVTVLPRRHQPPATRRAFVTAGGRVLGVTAAGADAGQAAPAVAYAALATMPGTGMQLPPRHGRRVGGRPRAPSDPEVPR